MQKLKEAIFSSTIQNELDGSFLSSNTDIIDNLTTASPSCLQVLTGILQYFLGCWMRKVRVECGFSTAGRTLLCLTLTGVSGKSWLSCGDLRRVIHKSCVSNPGGLNLTCKHLPCRELRSEGCQLVASCWRRQRTCAGAQI